MRVGRHGVNGYSADKRIVAPTPSVYPLPQSVYAVPRTPFATLWRFVSRRRVAVLAVLLGLAFALFNQLGVPLRASHSARVTADEPFYLLTTVSLIEDGDLDLANDYELRRYRAYFDHPQELWRQSVPTPDGRLLSPHNVGTSLLILPAYALGGLDGVKWFLAVMGGVTVAFTFLLARQATGNGRASLLAAALLGVSAPVFVYSTQIYPESPSALLVTVSMWLLLGRRRDWRGAVLLALAANGLVWLGAKYAMVAGALIFGGLIRFGTLARVLLLALLVPGAATYAWFHVTTYGGLTPYAVNALYAGNSTTSLLGLHLEVWNRLYRLVGLWVDGEFGLVRWAPVLLLALLALPALAHRPGPVRWAVPTVLGVQFLVAVFFSITMRGWWFPGRMLVAVLPLLAIPLAQALTLARGRRWLAVLAVALGIYTLALTLALRDAASRELVVLAVDPFNLPWLPFQAVAGLFPVYTDFGAATWLLTALWTLAALALVFLAKGRGNKSESRPFFENTLCHTTCGALTLTLYSPEADGRRGNSAPRPYPTRTDDHTTTLSLLEKGEGRVRVPPTRFSSSVAARQTMDDCFERTRVENPYPLSSQPSTLNPQSSTVIVGGGPAGLAAAYRLAQGPGQSVLLLEETSTLGGLAASFRHGDYILDYGPHRLHASTAPPVLADLRHLLGDELDMRPRRGQIRLGDSFFPYPIGPSSLLRLGPGRAFHLGAGMLASRSARPSFRGKDYETTIKSRLGEPLYRLFYGPYAEKVWGLPGHKIAADQAERRVNQRGLVDLILLAFGQGASRYYLYPRAGFGCIPAAYAEALAAAPAAQIELSAAVESVEWRPGRTLAIRYVRGGRAARLDVDHLIWTGSLDALIRLLDPPAPPAIQQAVNRLHYRAVVLCYVALAVPHVGRADTYYFPERRFPFNRVTEQKNFSPAMIPPERTVLCLDLACDPDGDLFRSSDEELRRLVLPALEEAGLARPRQVIEVFSRRFLRAYPVYDLDYQISLRTALDWLAGLENLWPLGRGGLFLHNNTHHSLLMGYEAADLILAANRDAWPAALDRFAAFRVAD